MRYYMKRLLFWLLFLWAGITGYCQEKNVPKVYTPPFKQGDVKWKSFNNSRERIKALQIPDTILIIMPTKELLEICLDFPYVTDMYAFTDPKRGFNYLLSEFNGYNELLNRLDVIDVLLDAYSKIESAVPFLSKASSIEKGKYSFKCDLLVRLIKYIEERDGLSKYRYERFISQTEKNLEIIGNNPELYCTMCKESVLSCKKLAKEQKSGPWYEGEIVTFSDGRKYSLTSRRTPLNSEVIAGSLITPDYDNDTKSAIADFVTQNYNVTVVGAATAKYNCHAYAWHMSDGHSNDEVWIGAKYADDEDIYWNDGSYCALSPSQATRVSYSGEHSAIRLGSGLYVSKWGTLPLVVHDSLNVPNGIGGYGVPVGFYRKFFLPVITGPSLICSSAIYSVGAVPSGYTVEWTLSDNYYNQNCLQQNFPSQNLCTITHDSYNEMMNATLTATIKYNGSTIKTVTKSGLNAYNGIKGHYISGELSGDFTYNYIYVKPNVHTYITSLKFYDATITYDTNLSIPTYWFPNPTNGSLDIVVPPSANGVNNPVLVYVDDVCGNHNVLMLLVAATYSLDITNREDNIAITLNDNENSQRNSEIDCLWSCEVRNATNGELKAAQSSNSRFLSISTSGWAKGVYIVKASIGKELITEKFILK